MSDSFNWKDALRKASEELAKKPLHVVQYESAVSWGARAYIAYQNFVKTKDYRWRDSGSEFYHELLEHGALAEGDHKAIVDEVRKQVEKVKTEADLIVKKKSFI